MEKKKLVSRHSPQWVRGICIGKGSFGTVSLAANVPDGRIFAVKSVNTHSPLPSHLQSLENEIRILQSLSSPYVVQYLGDDLTHESGNVSYRNLHLEYLLGGTIADVGTRFCGKGADLDEDIVRSYAWCILSALRYVHEKGFVHCDVKGRNVLLGSAVGVAKLADFGSAKRISGEEEGMILPRGSPLWMAPEVIRRERQGPESDVWSLGCTVIEMITGKPAWKDCGADTLCRIAFSDEVPEFPAQLSELGRDFLDKCLRREQSERWSCEQLLRHPFVSVGIVAESSPRCVLDSSASEFLDEDEEIGFSVNCNSENSNSDSGKFLVSAKGRIRELDSGRGAIWESDGWEVVRSSGSGCDRGAAATATESGGQGRGGTKLEYLNLMRIRDEEEVGTSMETWNVVSDREGCEGTRLEYSNFEGGCGGEWLCYVTTCPGWWCGYKAGWSWQDGLQRREKGLDSCCKYLLLIHLLNILILILTSS